MVLFENNKNQDFVTESNTTSAFFDEATTDREYDK